MSSSACAVSSTSNTSQNDDTKHLNASNRLPPGWIVCFSKTHSRNYYFHTKKNIRQWTPPTNEKVLVTHGSCEGSHDKLKETPSSPTKQNIRKNSAVATNQNICKKSAVSEGSFLGDMLATIDAAPPPSVKLIPKGVAIVIVFNLSIYH